VPHYDFVLGHEMTGTIHEVGEGVSKFKQGDLVVSPFTVNWCVAQWRVAAPPLLTPLLAPSGDCFYWCVSRL